MNSKMMTTGDKIFYSIVIILLSFFTIIILYPIIYIISASFSDPVLVMRNDIILLPKKLTLIGYEKVINHPDIWKSYGNTILYTVVGTTINVLMTALGAFPLSRKDFYGRNFWTIFVTFTMFASGGMIPSYILINKLHLINTFWVMVIPGAVSTWNLIVMRTFFQNNVPMELQEAAVIDGCNDIHIFLKVVLPLSAPIIAVMTLFYGVAHWNAFFGALIYLRDKSKYPLQLILREILLQNVTPPDMVQGGAGEQEIIGESIRYALIIVATLPIICVYPFIQKYFVKGMLIGAIKG